MIGAKSMAYIDAVFMVSGFQCGRLSLWAGMVFPSTSIID